MTLEELDNSLPNGLHDAQIETLLHDFKNATLKLDVEILVGVPGNTKADAYQYATITFSGVLFASIQSPLNERILGVPGSIWFTSQKIERDKLDPKLTNAIPENALCYSLYILEWESCITLAAMEMSFDWRKLL